MRLAPPVRKLKRRRFCKCGCGQRVKRGWVHGHNGILNKGNQARKGKINSLCRSCHGKTNTSRKNRKKWQLFFVKYQRVQRKAA